MDEQTIREVLVSAVQGANGLGVKDALIAAALGLVEAQAILRGEADASAAGETDE